MLEIAVGDRPTLFGDDVVYCDARTVAATPLVVCDVFGPMPFEAATFSRIAANHVLEHVSHLNLRTTLREWCRLLSTGGTIHVEVPNLWAYAREMLLHPENEETVRFIYGGQDMPNDLNTHRCGFTPHILQKVLLETGLQNVGVQVVGFALVAEGVAA